MTELKIQGERWAENYTIRIPYEINHDFFLEIELKIKSKQINIDEINIAGPDYGRGYILEGEKIDKYIEDCKYLKRNLDSLIKIVPFPKQIGFFDAGYTEGFKGKMEDSNYIDGGTKEITKEDVVFLLSLLEKKAKEAKKRGLGLEFVGD